MPEDSPSGLTDEEAKALVDKTICGIPCKLPYVYVRWIEMFLLADTQRKRLRFTGAEIDREMAERSQAMADALREQMNRLFP